MGDREGGQWNVGIKSGEVYLERVSEDGERMFDDALDAQEARDLARLLKKHADKLNDSDQSDHDGSDAKSDESDDNESEDDESEDDGSEDDDESDDSDDESDRTSG